MNSGKSLGFVGQNREMIMTKGYKSTEFWLSLVAIMTGAILSSGAIENNTVLQGLGLVATALSALGYAGARAITKSGEAKANAIKHIGISAGPKP